MADISFEELSRTLSSAAENVGKKTEEFIEVQKIRAQINSAARSVEKSYKDLGEMIYRRYSAGEGVDAEVAVLCEDIAQLQQSIIEKKEELASRKGKKICPTCEAEIDPDAVYCMKCGAKVAESQEDADDFDDESAQTLAEETVDEEEKAEEIAEPDAAEEKEADDVSGDPDEAVEEDGE